MATPLKIALWIVGGLLLCLTLVVGAVAVLFDPNDYRDDIEKQVSQQTGRTFTLGGDLGLSVFPWLRVTANDAQLANAEGFGPGPFARVDSMSAGIRLIPIFSGNIEFDTVTLDGLRLRLETAADGTNNWADLAENLTKDSADDPEAEEEPSTSEGAFNLESLTINSIDVSDASVLLDNRQQDSKLELKAFNLTTGRVVLGEPITVSSDFVIEQTAQDSTLSSAVDLVTELRVDLAGNAYFADNLKVDITAQGDAVPAGKQQFTLRGNLGADMAQGSFSASDLALQGVGATLTGRVEGMGLAGESADTGLSYNGSIELASTNPRAVFSALGMDAPTTTDESVLSALSLKSRISGTPDSIKLPELQAKLDQSTLTGALAVTSLDTLATTFDLQIDTLNVDRYLPPASDAPESADQNAPGNDELPLEFIEPLDVDGTLKIGALTAAGAQIENAVVTLASKPGRGLTQTLVAKVYGGKVDVSNTIAPGSSADQPPQFRLQGTLDEVLTNALLKDVAGQSWLSGSGFVKYDLTTAGTNADALKRALDGSVRLSLADGSIKGVDVARVLQLAQSQLAGAQADSSAEADGGQTKFEELAATLKLNNGMVRNDDLRADNEQVAVAGAGSFNLPTMELDYTLNTTLKDIGADSKLKELAGTTLPIRVTGPATKPKVRLDVASIVRARAGAAVDQQRARVEEKIEEEKGRVREQAGELIQRGLGGLLGGSRNKKDSEPPAEETPASGDDDAGG